MSINENDNLVESYLFPDQNLDWFSLPNPMTATVTLNPANGSPVTVNCPTIYPDNRCPTAYGNTDDTKTYFFDQTGQVKVSVHAGDSITVSYLEGIGTVQRPTTLSMANIPAVYLRPDLTTGTVGGVAPASWVATANLTSPPAPGLNPMILAPRLTSAITPFGFVDYSKKAIQLYQDYSGNIKASDTLGHQVWSAWAITGYLVKITGFPMPGDTKVCGTASPNGTVTIFDSSNPAPWPTLGTGPTDAQGAFCVTVSPALTFHQVIVAQDSVETLSQSALVGGLSPVYLSAIVN